MKLPDKKELVWITWKDAVNTSSRVHWESLKDQCLVCNSNVGWIVHETDERIVLAHGVSTSGEVDHFVIPVADIVTREPITARKREEAA
jgi:hypothetical protein